MSVCVCVCVCVCMYTRACVYFTTVASDILIDLVAKLNGSMKGFHFYVL